MGDVVTIGIFHRNIITTSELKTCTGEGSRQAQLLLSTSSGLSAGRSNATAVSQTSFFFRPSPGQQVSSASSEQELDLGLFRK